MKRSWLARVTKIIEGRVETSTQASIHLLHISMDHTRSPNEQFYFFHGANHLWIQYWFSILKYQNLPSIFPYLIFKTTLLCQFSFSSHSFTIKILSHTSLFHELNLRLLLQIPLCCLLVLSIIFNLLRELYALPKTDRFYQASRSPYHCSIQTFIENYKVQDVMLGTESKRIKIFSLLSKSSYFRGGDRYTNCYEPIKMLMYDNKET